MRGTGEREKNEHFLGDYYDCITVLSFCCMSHLASFSLETKREESWSTRGR
jgi:hypothetical protein